MTRDVVTIAEDAALDDAVELMERYHVKRLPVVKGDAMVGIVSRVNLLHAFLVGAPKDAPAPLDDNAICDRLTAELKSQPWLPRGSVQAIVKEGVVVLQGTVRDQRQRTALRVAAENVPGVKQVIDDLREIDLAVVS
jgi:CBS domain-containing protein